MNNSTITIDYDTLLRLCFRIRLIEERIAAIYPSDRIQSPVHLSLGQEAVAVGACAALAPDDLVYGSYRSHAYYLARGGDLGAMLAELFGKSGGTGGGKAGSMHLAAAEIGLMGSSAVVAGTIPHAVGSALAAKQRRTDQVVMATFGDGACEEGSYHESLNFAALHKLPVIFLCENNGLAIHAKLAERQAFGLREHAASYGLRVAHCPEGYDPAAVLSALAPLVADCRESRQPGFLEVATYRYAEHVGPTDDHDAGYRSRTELEAWQAHDPLIQESALCEGWRPEIEAEIEAAVEFAEASSPPAADALLRDVL